MRFSFALLAALALSGCGLRSSVESREYTFDGLKLLVKGENAPWDKNHYGQASYTLAPARRLLMRFESLSEHSVTIADDRRVMVQVGLANASDSELASRSLHLCPLSTDWMMLATWEQAHPFSDAGIWNSSGGDFDPTSCLTRDNRVHKQDGSLANEVQFDATRWYKDYPQARNQNFGFVLIADEPITILGETSASFSPRILFNVAVHWLELKTTQPTRPSVQ